MRRNGFDWTRKWRSTNDHDAFVRTVRGVYIVAWLHIRNGPSADLIWLAAFAWTGNVRQRLYRFGR